MLWGALRAQDCGQAPHPSAQAGAAAINWTSRPSPAPVATTHPVMHQVDYIRRERQLLDRLDDPGIVRLYFTFQDDSSLYFGLELCPNGGSILVAGVSVLIYVQLRSLGRSAKHPYGKIVIVRCSTVVHPNQQQYVSGDGFRSAYHEHINKDGSNSVRESPKKPQKSPWYI